MVESTNSSVSSVNISWDYPDDNGAAIDYFRYQLNISSSIMNETLLLLRIQYWNVSSGQNIADVRFPDEEEEESNKIILLIGSDKNRVFTLGRQSSSVINHIHFILLTHMTTQWCPIIITNK